MSAPPRRFAGDTLAIASHNPGKVREIAALLAPYVAHFPSAAALNIAEPDEPAPDFAGNAAIKARAVAAASGLPALADDSGLSVTALDGQPGVLSARWAGPEKDFTAAMTRIERELGPAADRSAMFVCALALAWPDGHVETVEGRIHGTLTFPPRGAHGFGYDPIFVPEGETHTFAEIEPSAKHAISHRARAFAQLLARCFQPD